MAAVIEEFVIHVRITYLRRGLVRLEMPDGSRSYSRGDRCFEVVR